MSTARAFFSLARETISMFLRHPDKMIAVVFHHYLGDPEKAKRLIEEMQDRE